MGVDVQRHAVIFTLIFDLGVVILSFKTLSGLYIRNHNMYKVETCYGH